MSSREKEIADNLDEIINNIRAVRGDAYATLVVYATNVLTMAQIFGEAGIPEICRLGLRSTLFSMLAAVGERMGLDMTDKELISSMTRDANAIKEKTSYGNQD